MENSGQKQPEVLNITEEEKKAMTEDLILTGSCIYTFKIASIPVEIKSLDWAEQKSLTSQIAEIPKKIDDREISLAEFSNLTSEYILKSQLKSFNGDSNVDISKLSSSIIEVIAKKIRLLNNTIVGLVSYENLLN